MGAWGWDAAADGHRPSFLHTQQSTRWRWSLTHACMHHWVTRGFPYTYCALASTAGCGCACCILCRRVLAGSLLQQA